MSRGLERFERIVRSVGGEQALEFPPSTLPDIDDREELHPFESRNIHPDLPPKVRKLFDDGHWEEAVFQAFKFIEQEVKRLSQVRSKTGMSLMMDAFNEEEAKIRLNQLVSESEIDEQRGFKFIFAGAVAGIRNPRGHEVDIGDTPDEALDYLALASLLVRRLDSVGLR